ncbi:WecB/TagA/CpsF family glycosyltransferase [Roseospira visakhapatnamensis]|uniref:Exopolysaccharide biosynthesis WecB/TagA/CpsF family protein n=1 Tax=Roseospira visakhapatnamensis TaxID=390880 RepID=A0A7W6RBV5_9PROT|nr:WecB/TagA/CpsF family glycosyltransferase [Roseospira visakhapatnamensis]MBB4265291.1 exopolysaccharide biosynthesis WecB/TagA/CpsF family protein [Roseospira visakhapatnamensis]
MPTPTAAIGTAHQQPAVSGPSDAPPPPRFTILGVEIDRCGFDEAVDWCAAIADGPTQKIAAFVNADCLNIASEQRDYRQALPAFDRVFADGSGIRLACRLLGQPSPDNVNGTDLLHPLCARLAQGGVPLFLLGAKPGVADAAADVLRDRHPGLDIVGTQHGFFHEIETETILTRINRSGAKVLLVAMGAPRQELWIRRYRDRLAPRLIMGVGGLLDFTAGRVSRAPAWVRRAGLEWTWRLKEEPGRMWRRYILGNPLFVSRVSGQRREEERAANLPARLSARYGSVAALIRDRWRARLRITLWHAGVACGQGAKRGLDIAVAGLLIIALTPLWLLLALAIRIDSPGPVLFSQMRVGRHGRLFRMWKFRSMYRDAEARKAALMAQNEMAGGVLFKMARDPRITRVGRIIRKASIDELPQLWNVLIGDMSLVGPRPPVPAEVAQYSLRDRRRLDGVPGITGLWQVSGRSSVPFPQQVEMDVSYNDSRSFWMDVWLLIRTIPAVLTGRGAV